MMKASQLKAIASAVALFVLLPSTAVRAQTSVTPADARVIAKEAYIYGYPMVDSYRIQHAYFVDTKNPEYKGPWNQLISFSRVFTPEDKAVQTPNSDTPYSFLGMDLRAEPIVLTVPAIEKDRYFSIQLIDAYTFNFAYIGSRATGNDGGSYLIAGPGWKGEAPKGVKKVIRAGRGRNRRMRRPRTGTRSRARPCETDAASARARPRRRAARRPRQRRHHPLGRRRRHTPSPGRAARRAHHHPRRTTAAAASRISSTTAGARSPALLMNLRSGGPWCPSAQLEYFTLQP
jgi:hypothetical protein